MFWIVFREMYYPVYCIICNTNEKELQIRSKCMVYVPDCLFLNRVKLSAGSSNRCIKFYLSVKISKKSKSFKSSGSRDIL